VLCVACCHLQARAASSSVSTSSQAVSRFLLRILTSQHLQRNSCLANTTALLSASASREAVWWKSWAISPATTSSSSWQTQAVPESSYQQNSLRTKIFWCSSCLCSLTT
jgi:DNA polymerase III, beta subunit (EC 2.7.7.7)